MSELDEKWLFLSWSVDMTLFRRKDAQKETRQFTLEDYEKTFAVTKAILRLGGLRLMRQDSNIIRLIWDTFYWFSFGNLFIVTWLELVHMVKTTRGGSFQDAIDIFRMMPCMGYLFLAMTKSYKIVYYRPIYENLYSELRDMWPRGPVSDEEHHIIKVALKQLNIVIQGYYWCNNVLLVIFLSPPFVEIFKRVLGYDVPLILPFFYWFPFDPFIRGIYEVILAFQTWHGLITIWFMLCGDLLFCIYLSHITTQFDLLAARVRRMVYVPVDRQLVETFPLATYSREYLNKPDRNKEILDRDWEKIHQKDLSTIIKRHRALIRLSTDVENMFSFSLLVNFFNSSIIICFCGFCCVIVEKWNEMVYKSFLITALSQTWLLCWYGQRLQESNFTFHIMAGCKPIDAIRKSEGLSDALYNSGWYRASNKIKSSVLIMLHRSQKPIHVTTYGFSVISLMSYTTIIKTSWSYFTLLLNIYKQ